MRQLITLAALAAMAVGGWLAWPTIKAKFLANQDNPAPNKDPGPTPQNPPTPPNPNPPNPATPDLGAKTPISSLPPDAKTQEPVTPAGNVPPAGNPTGSNEKTPDRPANAKLLRVDLAADLVSMPPPLGVGSWTYGIDGTTTLPAGVELHLWATGEGDNKTQVPGRSDPEKVVVQRGTPRNVFRWVSVPFPTAKSFRIVVALRPEQQPAAVQQTIGLRGELLTGPLVTPVDTTGNYLHTSSVPFLLPAGKAAAKVRRMKLVFQTTDGEPSKGKSP